MEDLWDIKIVDGVVYIIIVATIIFIFIGIMKFIRIYLMGLLSEKHIEVAFVCVGLAGGVLAVYVAHSTLRNQTKLSAETAINQDAGRLLDWERSSPSVRCTYSWFDRLAPLTAGPRPDQDDTYDPMIANECLAKVVANRKNFTEVMLYTEEVFFILQQAKRDQDKWGSAYAEEIQYWRADVGEDMTGLFSYHLLNRYPINKKILPKMALLEPNNQMAKAGVEISDLCGRARRVTTCLEAAGRFADPIAHCADYKPSAHSAQLLVGVASACQAEAQRIHVHAEDGD